MSDNTLDIIPLTNDLLWESALKLQMIGTIKESASGLSYLKITDGFIHQLYPLIQQSNVNAPNYFDDHDAIGAHISVIYPEEQVRLRNEYLGREISFHLNRFYMARLCEKQYFVLGVSAPDLINLRQDHGLGAKLYFKNHWIDLHITIGTRACHATHP